MNEQHEFVKFAMCSFSPDLLETKNVTRWLLEQLHRGGPKCPVCQEPVVSETGLNNFYSLRRIKCTKCNGHSNAAAGTILNGLKFDIRLVYLMAILLGLGVDKAKIAKQLDLHFRTVCIWEDKFASIGTPQCQP